MRTPAAFVLALVALLTVVGVAAPAQASGDVVRALDVVYEVRADGTVRATHTLDWDFGGPGRHGIEFGIVTAEPWDLDASQEARYGVSGLTVSSPTGAPVGFEETSRRDGAGVERMLLRIGDPGATLDSSRETYVISYDLTGALRTFDSGPELFLDVTGPDYPGIEQFTVTVRAAGAISRARCLAGTSECGARVSGDEATLSGDDVPAGTVISAVAALPAAQGGAKPDLHPRDADWTFLVSQDTVVDIGADGVAHVTQDAVHHVSGSAPHLTFTFPARRRDGFWRDRVYEVSRPRVVLGGTELDVELHRAPRGNSSSDYATYRARVPEGTVGKVQTTSTWNVRGTVDTNGDVATFAWRLSPSPYSTSPTTERFEWRFPDDARSASCVWDGPGESRDCKLPEPRVDGAAVVLEWQGVNQPRLPDSWLTVELPASAVGHAEWKHAWSGDLAAGGSVLATIGTALLGLGSVVGLGFVAARIRPGRDLRYADAPPGQSGKQVTDAPFRGTVPVRFEPPDASPAAVGFVLDRGFRSRHVAATLTQMAVTRAIQLASKPLMIVQRDPTRLASDLERDLYGLGHPHPRALSAYELRRLNSTVESYYNAVAGKTSWFRKGGSRATVALRLALWLGVLGLVAVSFLAGWPGGVRALLIFCVALFGFGFIWGMSKETRRLGPRGVAVRQQAEGFRQFIRTAEARQLSFEAEQDIYRAYLPWAVLFGETKRWTEVCEKLAAAGRIPRPDPSFVVGATSVRSAHASLSAIGNRLAVSELGSRASTAGGRSGFSSGSMGGGGGGGTSARSW